MFLHHKQDITESSFNIKYNIRSQYGWDSDALLKHDTNVVGFIPNNERSSSPCLLNNLLLNTSKTKEVIVDYRRSRRTEHPPLLIRGQ